ncbi:MAG TPA: NmrA family NAD(P)-binding protein [Candidatus Dormibacteraeota bacterium]|nr:NmrA family NAD(P)-binding protein [Candidatus Dormibacteraeota bacterium]
MKPRIAVIGGTDWLGSMVVEKLRQKGNNAVAASPDTGVYPMSGEGAVLALEGVEVVVDVANAPSFEDQAAWDFFQVVGENLAVAEVADAINFFRTAHENLAVAEVAAGVKHHVALSVVGIESLQDGAYFRAKLIQENMIKGSPVPHTIIRATQLFDYVRPIAQAGTDGDKVRVPHALFQPVAVEDVVNAVAEVALEAPRNGTVEIAGPEVFYIDDLVARVLEHDRDPRNVAMDDPGGLFFSIAVDDQSLMPGRDVRLGSTTFDWWLTHNPGQGVRRRTLG